MTDFMQHAVLAGTAVALAAGMVGYFLVLRAQVFTADALSHVAFTGALAALAAGVDVRVGLFVVTVVVALGMGGLGARARPDDVVIGGLFAWILGLGVLFLSVFTGTRGDGSGVTVLFGSILGVSAGRAAVTAVVGVAIGLAVVGVTVAEANQVVGALLVLGLLAAPAGAAARLTARPLMALGLSAGIAVASVWVGLAVTAAVPAVPPSFAILTTAAAVFAAASLRREPRTVRTTAEPGVVSPISD